MSKEILTVANDYELLFFFSQIRCLRLGHPGLESWLKGTCSIILRALRGVIRLLATSYFIHIPRKSKAKALSSWGFPLLFKKNYPPQGHLTARSQSECSHLIYKGVRTSSILA